MKLIEILVRYLPENGGWPEWATRARQSDHNTQIYISNDGYWKGDKGIFDFGIRAEDCSFCSGEFVTREEYEAALAASKEMLINKPARVIGRFIPIGQRNGRTPFSVKTREKSNYLAPAWMGEKWDGTPYHVTEKAWIFEPLPETQQPVWSGEGLPPVGCEFEYSFHADGYASWHWRKCTATGKHVALCVDKNDTELYLNDETNNFRPIRTEAERKREDTETALRTCLAGSGAGITPLAAKNIYDAIAAGKIPGVKLE